MVMKTRVRYNSFEELKQEREEKTASPASVQRHKEMEDALRVIRKKWLEQKAHKQNVAQKKSSDE